MSKTDKAEISELAKLMFTFKDSVSPEEQEYYLKLLGLCKEIKDSFYPVDGNSKTSILDMRFTRKVDHCNEEYIYMSGFAYINDENRCISGEIFNDGNRIILDILVERLGEVEGTKTYRVLEEFRKNKKSYTHHTYYDGKHEKEMFDLEFNKVKTR